MLLNKNKIKKKAPLSQASSSQIEFIYYKLFPISITFMSLTDLFKVTYNTFIFHQMFKLKSLTFD